MRSFRDIQATAELHKGGAKALEALLPRAKSARALRAMGDDRYLSAISLRIFQAGLKHSMVAAKWPAFEAVFKQFDPYFCAMLSDEFIEQCMQNRDLIRHMGKLKAIRSNAQMVLSIAREHGSFGQWVASWPEQDIVGLWLALKKQGAQLGGQSAARVLRMVGKDTFLLTDDVVAVLKAEGVVQQMPTSKRDLQAAQAAFSQWRDESGRPLCEISRIVSVTTA